MTSEPLREAVALEICRFAYPNVARLKHYDFAPDTGLGRVVDAILSLISSRQTGGELTEAMIEAGCRAMHEEQGTGDADAPLHSPHQKSWDEPDSVRWKQWIEAVTAVYRAMIGAAPDTPSLPTGGG